MNGQDHCVTIAPYFKVQAGRLEAFKKMCGQFVETTRTEPGCLFYGFTFDGDKAHCREGYADAGALLVHLQSVGTLLKEVLQISEITRLEVHGPETELARLREPLANLNPQYFVLECGFRR